MIDHYNAFISYKHAPADIEIAKLVQRELEKYHIPSTLQKKIGKKKIERIFRDKDDLPITSDLSETISFALDHSDNLIVICSPETKKSEWVIREIKFFMEKHGRNKIFTVLVSGEPYEVIPEILLKEERTVIDSNGNETTVTVDIEPLFCDFRESAKNVRKEEITRLAAAVIGCTYDELMNRRRAYEMKRNFFIFAGVFAVAAAFAGYMVYSNIKVQAALDESLRNRSIYLANESMKRMDNEDRINALAIALEALPSDEHPDYPVTSNAMRAITKSTLAYTTLSGINLYATWVYDMPREVSDYSTTNDGNYFVASDIGGNVYVWSTDDHKATLEYKCSNLRFFKIISDDVLLIADDYSVIAFSIKDGEEIWKTEFKSIPVMPSVLNSGNIILPTVSGYVFELSYKDGSMVKEYNLTDNSISGIALSKLVVSPDDTKFAYSTIAVDSVVCTYNTKTNQKSELKLDSYMCTRNLLWYDNNKLLLSYNKMVGGSQYNSSSRILSPDHTTIGCYTPDLINLWTKDFETNEVAYTSGFIDLSNNKIPDLICYYMANMVRYYNVNDGELVYENNTISPIVHIYDTQKGKPYFITRSGEYGSGDFDGNGNSVILTPYFTDKLVNACVRNGGVFVSQEDSSSIVYYDQHVYDKGFTKIENDDSFYSINMNSYIVKDDSLALINCSSDIRYLSLIDMENETVSYKLNLAETEGSNEQSLFKLLDIVDQDVYLLRQTEGVPAIFKVDKNGEVKITALESKNSINTTRTAYANNKFCYVSTDISGADSILYYYDIVEDEFSSVTLKGSGTVMPDYMKTDGNHVFVNFEKSGLYLFNIEEDELDKVDTPDNWNPENVSAFMFPEKDLICICDGSTMLFMDMKKQRDKFELSCDGVNPIGMTQINDDLLVFYNNGDLVKYDINSGTALGIIHTGEDIGFTQVEATFQFNSEANILCINHNYVSYIIDYKDWYNVTNISYGMGYDMKRDRFYVTQFTLSNEMNVGYFKRYTLDELIFKAKEILDGQTISSDLRAELGI